MIKVRVFCPICRDGNNVIWEGSLEEWGVELSKETPPDWANYAYRHEEAHGHQIMVKYPTRTVPFRLGEAE